MTAHLFAFAAMQAFQTLAEKIERKGFCLQVNVSETLIVLNEMLNSFVWFVKVAYYMPRSPFNTWSAFFTLKRHFVSALSTNITGKY